MLNTSRIRILTIGKIKKPWIQDGLNIYLKRLPGLQITELRDSTPSLENKSLQASIKKNEFSIALAEEGEVLNSLLFADRLQKLNSKRLVFLIGGAEGLNTQLKSTANLQVSLSPLTFPHEIARLLLVEQIYRAQTILQGTPYHRN